LSQAWLKEQTTAQVFKVLNDLQHPGDCASARKLVCMLNKGCGFACQIHHVVHCLTHAVALNRTMVLKVRHALQVEGPGA
jgi:glycoprotein 6-alpha-L-fucosyltransferase